jgi:hypothetical protein
MAAGPDRATSLRELRGKRRPKLLLAGITPRRAAGLCVVGCLSAFLAAVTPAIAFQLVTPEEAALPPGVLPTIELRGSPTRRPSLTVVSPPPNAGLVHSPLDVKLQFRAFGGAEIDPGSVVVTYLKDPAIDITQRITPFISAAGIDVSQAEVPPGKHQFWVELKDKAGRVGGGEFSFRVAK